MLYYCIQEDAWKQYGIAVLYSLAGDIDNAILWLKMSYEEHNPNMPYLLSPVFDSLRDDPRFKDLQRKMNLPEAARI